MFNKTSLTNGMLNYLLEPSGFSRKVFVEPAAQDVHQQDKLQIGDLLSHEETSVQATHY